MRFKCYQKDPPIKGRKVLSMYDWKNWYRYSQLYGLPRWLSGKGPTCQCRSHRRPRFHPWVRKIPWRRKWLPSLVFLPGKFHGKRERGELQLTGSQRIVRNSAHTHSQLSLALKVITRPHSGAGQWLVPPIPSQQEQPALCCLVIQHRVCLVILLLKSFNSVAPGHPPISAKFCSFLNPPARVFTFLSFLGLCVAASSPFWQWTMPFVILVNTICFLRCWR